MDIIHLLPDAVANQIAAGEVVQRPASVIKELLENSIDAGATQIKVILRDSGKELTQVIDNGKGMSPTDARMAFERHATSKITQASDLFALHTMGFRGEALASIVAVAEVDLKTRRAEDEAGVFLRMAGSKVLSQESVVCPVGTNLEVRNLFYNVPARRNFLKSNETELKNIITELQHVAMANPQVEFTLISDDKQLFQLTSGSYKQRILQIFGKSLGQQLIPLEVDNTLLNVEGFICQPEGARKKGAMQYFFVNDRYMRHLGFHKAVMESYQHLIPEGSQPNYFIYMQVDPSTIDVNVHPTKTEIKFQNEPARGHILKATITQALGKFNAVPAIDFDQADAPEIEAYDPGKLAAEPKVDFNRSYDPFRDQKTVNSWSSGFFSEKPQTSVAPVTLDSQLNSFPDTDSSETFPSRLSTILDATPDYESDGRPVAQSEMGTMESKKSTFRKYLQVGGRYIAASTKKGLVLIDQHQAHMAVLFDRYYHQIKNRQGVSQLELIPEQIEVSLSDAPLLEKILPQLRYLGFEIDYLGGGSFAVNGKPATLDKSIDLQGLIHQVLEVVHEETKSISDSLDRKLAIKLSRAEALSPGKILSEEEMSQLVDALYDLPEHVYTPDGHVIAFQLSVDEISSHF